VDAYDLGDGRTVLLLAEGRVVNLVAAEGHPPEVMDLAFGIEALALAWLAAAVSPDDGGKLPVGVHEVPADIDAEAARLVLAAAGTSIDALTPAQRAYLESWRIGSLSGHVIWPRRARSVLGWPGAGSRWASSRPRAAGSAAATRRSRSGRRSSPTGWPGPA